MTYVELISTVDSMRAARSSAVNRKRLLERGLGPGVWEFKGSNGRKYRVAVNAGRFSIGYYSKHRKATLDKWCRESIGHVVELF